MINISKDQLIPIRDIPKMLPKRPNGKNIHIATVYRWTSRGVRGIKLGTVRVAGTQYTTVSEFMSFIKKQQTSRNALELNETSRQDEIKQIQSRLGMTIGMNSFREKSHHQDDEKK